MRLNPHEVRLNIKMNISAGGSMGQIVGRGVLPRVGSGGQSQGEGRVGEQGIRIGEQGVGQRAGG